MITSAGREAPPEQVVRRMVELACLAPSVANSQPWAWRASGDEVGLYVDRGRQDVIMDPVGRHMWISCGTALHHFRLAARVLGWRADVEQVPDPVDATLVARIRLHREPCPDGASILAAIRARSTDQRRFTTWPVPRRHLDMLCDEAGDWGASASAVTDCASRFRLELLARREPGMGDGTGVEVESSDDLIVLGGEEDDTLAWVRSGEALSALWIRATQAGLSVLPLCRPPDVPAVRAVLQEQVAEPSEPHLLVRIGWQPLGRSELARTTRRSVNEVLRE